MEFLRYEEVPGAPRPEGRRSEAQQEARPLAERRTGGPGAPPLASDVVTRKRSRRNHAAVTCEVCGRTLLRGEQRRRLPAGGARRHVCELCTARAAHEGWIREGLDDAPSVAPPRRAAPRLAPGAPAPAPARAASCRGWTTTCGRSTRRRRSREPDVAPPARLDAGARRPARPSEPACRSRRASSAASTRSRRTPT